MIKVKVEGDKRFKRLLAHYAKETGKGVGEAIEEMALTGGRKLMIATEPYGAGGKARNVGEKAASSDIAKVYSAVSKVTKQISAKSKRKAAIYRKYINDGNFSAAARVASRVLGKSYKVGEFDGGSLHKAARDAQGDVADDARGQIVVGDGEVADYHRDVSLKVGGAKAGWYRAMLDITGSVSRIQKWIKRHTRGGHGKKRGRGMKTEITLTNTVPYIRNVLNSGKVKRAMMGAMRGTKKRMEKALDHAGRKLR